MPLFLSFQKHYIYTVSSMIFILNFHFAHYGLFSIPKPLLNHRFMNFRYSMRGRENGKPQPSHENF